MKKISLIGICILVLIFMASLALAQAPAFSAQKKAEIASFASIGDGLSINLNGDTLYRVRQGSFDGGVGIDLATYKGIVNLRAELSQSTDGSPFSGAGLMLNIPNLLNLLGASWQAGAINPSIGVVPGWDFGEKRFDVGVVLSVISVTF